MLQHAVVFSHFLIMGRQESWLKTRPDRDSISDEVRDALDAVKRDLFDYDFGEPFWEDEYRVEPGFALENQVRGQATCTCRHAPREASAN